MRRIRRSVSFSAVVVSACLPQASGGGKTSDSNIQSAPSAAALHVQTQPSGTTGQVNVTVDLVALDSDGKSYAGVQGADVTFDAPTDGSATGTLGGTVSCTSSQFKNTDRVASVVLLMDQSGSISGTDPQNLRVAGGKEFLRSAGGDEVLLMSFAQGNTCAGVDVKTYGSFTTDTSQYLADLDGLVSCEGGGTPLWDASSQALDQLVQNGKNTVKALVVFTDGQDSASYQPVIDKAVQAKIKIFTVGLSSSVEAGVLSSVSQQTNGAFFYAEDVGSMVSAFRGMNLVLTGDYDKHSCQQQMTLPSNAFATVTTTAHVRVNGLEALAPLALSFVQLTGAGGSGGGAGTGGTGGSGFGTGGSSFGGSGFGTGGSPFGAGGFSSSGGFFGAGGAALPACPPPADFTMASAPYTLDGNITGAGLSGRLLSSGLTVPSNYYTLTFSLYTSDLGGVPVWNESQTVWISGTCFTTSPLGSVNPLSGLPAGGYWLDISIDQGIGELAPRYYYPLTVP